jgi:dihydroflavonol-4-reductase
MKVLVTGATGFVGRKLVPRILEEGYDVVTLVRATSNTESLSKKIEIREADLLDIKSLEAVVHDVSIVVHLAAYFDFYPSSKELLYKVNVEGTKNLMSACVGTNVERFIYCSSTEAIGPVRFPPGTEDSQLNPTFDYGDSKGLAEQAIREITRDTKLEHIILRPSGILGEGDFYTAFEAIEAINDGTIPMIPGDGEKGFMYIHIDDVVEGFIKALTSKSALNNTIILCPNQGMTWNELFAFVSEYCGVDPPKRKIPTSLAKIGIGLLSPIKNRGKTTFLWHMKTVQSMDENRIYDNSKAKRVLGWEPKITMKEGLKRAIDWYFENGFLVRRS